jgi:LDH2 family malate/lactate/ureidoglycolate dehydrogenase
MVNVGAEEARRFAEEVLSAAGMADEDASATAQMLVEANLRGIDSHGVLRLIQYSQALADGDVNPRPRVREVRRFGATALIDADGGYGFRPTLQAVDTVVELARAHGVAVVGVRASHHFGAAGAYAQRIAEAGLVAVVTTNSSPVIAPPAGRRPVVGNNPIAIATPRGGGQPPIVTDVALSEVAYGKIRHAATEGRPIPLGWARDHDGRPTTDAAVALAAHSLEPIGAHKGYALALAVELLAGALTGSPVGTDSNPHEHVTGGVGHLLIAIDPRAFGEVADFDAATDRMVGMTRQAAAGHEDDIVLPGDPERRTVGERRASGIPLSAELVAELGALTERLGVERPAWIAS